MAVQAADPPAPLVDGDPWIAFQKPEARGHAIHLVRPDGTDAHFPLADVPGGEQLHADWSPDGKWITFDVANDEGTYDIWVADTTDWSTERVVDCVAPCLWVNEPSWSPDGTTIAFQRHSMDGEAEISSLELLDVESRELKTVLTTGSDEVLYAPRWSPGGDAIVVELPSFVDGELTGVSLATFDLATDIPSLDKIVPPTAFANNPDWSPDGLHIVFSAPIEGGEAGGALSDLWMVRSDGSDLIQVTDVAASAGSAVQPTFTPDGQRIIFMLTDAASGDSQIMATIALDGTDLQPATGSDPMFGWHPRLRPTE
jgi:Tol biopolymer transport system component